MCGNLWGVCVCVCVTHALIFCKFLATLGPSNMAVKFVFLRRAWFLFNCFVSQMVVLNPTSIALRTKWHHQKRSKTRHCRQMANQHANSEANVSCWVSNLGWSSRSVWCALEGYHRSVDVCFYRNPKWNWFAREAWNARQSCLPGTTTTPQYRFLTQLTIGRIFFWWTSFSIN